MLLYRSVTQHNTLLSAQQPMVGALIAQLPQYLYVLTAADSSPAQLSTTGWLKPL